MAPDIPTDADALRLAVGDELRAVVEALLDRATPPDGLAASLELLRAARAELQGPPEAPVPGAAGYWTEGGASGGWDAYMDVNMFGGRVNPLGMPMPVELGDDEEGRPFAEGVVRLGRPYAGGPGMVHGGYVAALIDHVFGAALHAAAALAVTATLTIRYLEPTPLGRDLRVRAWFDTQRGRRLHGRATLHAGDTCTAEAEGLFLRVDMQDMASRVAEGRARAAGRRPGAAR